VRFLILAVVVSLALLGCGRGYDVQNRQIVEELPDVAGLTLEKTSFRGYCSKDTCTFGNDRSSATLAYRVDASALTQQQVIDAYVAALRSWRPSISERCANADPSFCDKITYVSFARGDAVVSLDFLNWRVGRFGVGVDAHAG
jgi:hypothetical protein